MCLCCVCFLPNYSGHQVRWTCQPGSHRISHPPSFWEKYLLANTSIYFIFFKSCTRKIHFPCLGDHEKSYRQLSLFKEKSEFTTGQSVGSNGDDHYDRHTKKKRTEQEEASFLLVFVCIKFYSRSSVPIHGSQNERTLLIVSYCYYDTVLYCTAHCLLNYVQPI